MRINVVILFMLAISLSMTGERKQDNIILMTSSKTDNSKLLDAERIKNKKTWNELEKTLMDEYELVPKNKR